MSFGLEAELSAKAAKAKKRKAGALGLCVVFDECADAEMSRKYAMSACIPCAVNCEIPVPVKKSTAKRPKRSELDKLSGSAAGEKCYAKETLTYSCLIKRGVELSEEKARAHSKRAHKAVLASRKPIPVDVDRKSTLTSIINPTKVAIE